MRFLQSSLLLFVLLLLSSTCQAQNRRLTGTFTGPCQQNTLLNGSKQFSVTQFQFSQENQESYNQVSFVYVSQTCAADSLLGKLELKGTYLLGDLGSAIVDNSIGGGDPPANLEVIWATKSFTAIGDSGKLVFTGLCNLTFPSSADIIFFEDTGCVAAGIPSNAQCPNFFTVIQTSSNGIYMGTNTGITSCTPASRTTQLDPTKFATGNSAGKNIASFALPLFAAVLMGFFFL